MFQTRFPRAKNRNVTSLENFENFNHTVCMASGKRKIVFFHPDLGIGGAERLVIDAAVGLQQLGHRVTIFTSHRDPSHCFDEARDGK